MKTATQSAADVIQTSALQAAAPIVLALLECDDELRQMAVKLFEQLSSGELDEDQRCKRRAANCGECACHHSPQRMADQSDLLQSEVLD